LYRRENIESPGSEALPLTKENLPRDFTANSTTNEIEQARIANNEPSAVFQAASKRTVDRCDLNTTGTSDAEAG
jgi:hypothetical protein